MSRSEMTGRLLAAVRELPGLRPAVPAPRQLTSLLPGDWEGLAVDLEADVVRIRLIALHLPLQPLLVKAGEELRAVLAGTGWERARLQLVVTDIDGAALRGCPDPGHGSGP
jgi:hypothetical protein